MKRHSKRGSLFTLLLGNYILFTLLVVAAFVLAFALAFFGTDLNTVELKQASDYRELLAAGRYEDFPVVRLLGENGRIVVLDERGRPVYDPGGIHPSLSIEELAYIPDARASWTFYTNELTAADGSTHHQITCSDGGKQELYVLDGSYRVLYGSGSRLAGQLSPQEYQLLTNRFFEGWWVTRLPFQTEAGNSYTLLLFQDSANADALLKEISGNLSEGVLLFDLFYILLILLLIFWLKRRINRPLHLLRDTFQNYQIGGTLLQNYRGPREFVEIFDNFSDMASRLEDSERQRRALEEERRKMLADIAHDLKTPVSVIQGYASALRDGVIPPEEQAGYLNILGQKSAGLNELVNTFYEYSKLEHPDFSLNLVPEDICNYFRDFVAGRYTELELAGFAVEAEIPEEHIVCRIDRGQLERAFANIVGNAVKHTPPDTTLYFALRREEGTVRLLLADNGPGIPKDIAQRIFTPFVVGDASRGGNGSGLGLSIAKRIVEAHGGSICLTSAPNPRWTTAFEITLPIL